MRQHPIDKHELRLLANNTGIRTCNLQPAGKRWVATVKAAGRDYIICTTRPARQPREFYSIDTVCQFLRRAGITSAVVNLGHDAPPTLKGSL